MAGIGVALGMVFAVLGLALPPVGAGLAVTVAWVWMAGLASVLLSQTYFVSPFSGATPMVKGMVVALAGGLGSIGGAIIAAVMVGTVEAFTALELGGQYGLITQFRVISAGLLIRPRGIAGMIEHTRE